MDRPKRGRSPTTGSNKSTTTGSSQARSTSTTTTSEKGIAGSSSTAEKKEAKKASVFSVPAKEETKKSGSGNKQVKASRPKDRKKDKDDDSKIDKFYKTAFGRWVSEHKGLSAVIFVLWVYLSGILTQLIDVFVHLPDYIAKEREFTFGIKNFTYWCTTGIKGFVCLLLSTIIFWAVWRFVIYPRIEIKTGKDEGDRNITYSDKDTYGTSSMAEEDEINQVLDIKSIDETMGIILGETEDGEIISLPTAREIEEKKKKYHWTWDDINNNVRNKNILVIGSPGTMKTRGIIMNSVIQAMRRGESLFVTDPKGELYEKTKVMLEKNGYIVKAFNLVNQEHSDSWNPFLEVGDDSTNAKIFADAIVNNATDNTGDQYWNDNSMNFIKACLMLGNSNSLGALYDFISGTRIEDFENYFATRADRETALRAFRIFNQCTDVVKGQIINSLGIMIDVFQDDKIRNITTEPEIDLTLPATKKCAYFVITSDQHRTFDYLAVLFWTMAFVRLVRYIDDHKDKNGDPTTLPINFLFDEFSNIGIIPDFTKKISTVRSRNIYMTLIIQNLAQLENRYPNGAWEEIASCCDTTLFLGCNDNTTAEYISSRTGIATIESETFNTQFAKDEIALNADTKFKKVKSVGQRTVMNPDEVLRMKNTDELILERGMKPYKCRKYDYSHHPLSNQIEKVAINEYEPEWARKKREAEEKARAEREAEIAEHEAEQTEDQPESQPEAQEEQSEEFNAEEYLGDFDLDDFDVTSS